MAFKTLQKPFLITVLGASTALFSAQQSHAQCVPTFAEGCYMGDAINNISITGDEGTSLVQAATGCASGAYVPPSGASAVTFTQGGSYTVTLSTNYYAPSADEGDMAAVWIDYNNNGEFEVSERVGMHNALIPTTGGTFSISLPMSAVVGTYNMRVMVGYNYDADFNPITAEDFHPCNTGSVILDYGEVHDYTITVLEAPLSVNLTDFSATRTSDNVVALDWTTHSERFNKGFHIWRSNDGKNFESIGFVHSKANPDHSSQSIGYRFMDVDAPTSTTYYQLEQINEDGKTLRTEVLSVNASSTPSIVAIYPNPAKDLVHIQAPKNFGKAATISLFDLNGRALTQHTVSSEYTTIDISQLPAGVYVIQYMDAGNTQTMKLTKN